MYGAYATWLGRELRSVDSNELRSYIWPAWYNRWGSLMREIWQGILVPSMRYTAFRAAVSPRLGASLSRLWQKLPVAIRYRLWAIRWAVRAGGGEVADSSRPHYLPQDCWSCMREEPFSVTKRPSACWVMGRASRGKKLWSALGYGPNGRA